MIVVAKKNISVLQLFISRMPKMCAILQLVSAPLKIDYKTFKQTTGTMIPLVYVGSIVI